MQSVIHRAAPPDGLVQKCALCGVVLSDWNGAMVCTEPDRDGNVFDGPAWWAVGAAVEVSGSSPFTAYSITTDPPTCEGAPTS